MSRDGRLEARNILVYLLHIHSLSNNVHLCGLQLVGGGVEDAQVSVQHYVDHVAAVDGLNPRDVTDLGGNHHCRLGGVEDRQAATDFAKGAAASSDVDV